MTTHDTPGMRAGLLAGLLVALVALAGCAAPEEVVEEENITENITENVSGDATEGTQPGNVSEDNVTPGAGLDYDPSLEDPTPGYGMGQANTTGWG